MTQPNINTKKSRLDFIEEFESAPESALFKQDTLCALLDCSPALLERDRWAGGGIPFVKMGRSVRYRKSDVLIYLNGLPTCHSTVEQTVGGHQS